MRRNGYLWTSGVNLNTAVRFADPDFLSECNISVIWRRFRWFFHYIYWISAIFLLPVCLTYWSRKYTTRVDPHIDSSHKVWSWYDHSLSSYSVFVCWYVHVTLWPWLWPLDLEQLMYMAGHVADLATKFADPTPIRSWFMSYDVSRWLPLTMSTWPLRMHRITWPVSRGSKTITFLEPPTPICIFTIQLRWLYDEYY